MSYAMNAEGTNGVGNITVIGTDSGWQLVSGPVMVLMDTTGGLGPPPPLDVNPLECRANGAAPAVVGNNGNGPGVVGVTAFSVPPPGQPYPGTGKNAGVYGESPRTELYSAGVRGECAGGSGVFGKSEGSVFAAGVRGECADGSGVYGKNVSDGGAGVQGHSAEGPGVLGWTLNTSPGVFGYANTDVGVRGFSGGSGKNSYGVWGGSEWIGVFGEGLSFYPGVAGHGKRLGVQGEPGDKNGVGVLGYSDAGEGVHTTTTDGTALYAAVQGPPFPANSYAGNFIGDVIISGSLLVAGQNPKMAAVPHPDGSTRGLYSLESPESWFEDFGRSQLVDGTAHIAVDPDFAAVVDAGKCHVFLTPYGDCNGLYVAGLTATSFAVREHKGGTSNVEFSYRLVAKRKDIKGERLPKITLPPRPPEPPRLESPPDPGRFRPRNLDVAPATP